MCIRDRDLSGAELGGPAGPFDRVKSGRLAAAVGSDLVTAGLVTAAARIDTEDEHLATESVRDLGDDVRARNRAGVDAHFVGARPQQFVDVLDAAHAAADCQGDEYLFGGAADDFERGVP